MLAKVEAEQILRAAAGGSQPVTDGILLYTTRGWRFADLPDTVIDLANLYTQTQIDTMMADKSDVGHLHDDRYYTETEITTLLSGKSDVGHLHVWADITDPPATATRWADWSEVTGKPATFPPSAHTHPQSEVTNLVTDLAAKANLSGASFTGAIGAPDIDVEGGHLNWEGYGATTGFARSYYQGDTIYQLRFYPADTAKAAVAAPFSLGVYYQGSYGTVWHSLNDGSGSGLDADLLDGYHGSVASGANTVAIRDGANDLNARLLRSEYTSTTGSGSAAYIMVQNAVGAAPADNYVRPATIAQVKANMGLANITDSAPANYGSLEVAGSTNGYAGFQFTAVSRYLMVSPQYQGIYTGSAWQWLFDNGVMTVGTVQAGRLSGGTFGAGSYTFPSDATVSGQAYFKGWVRIDPGTGNTGVYWQSGSGTGFHIYPDTQYRMLLRAGGTYTYVSLGLMEGNGTLRGHIHANSSGEIGFLSAGHSWLFRLNSSGHLLNDFQLQDSELRVFRNTGTTPAGNSHIGRVEGDGYLSFHNSKFFQFRAYSGTAYTTTMEVTMNGLLLMNAKPLQGRTTGGAVANIIQMSATDRVRIGMTRSVASTPGNFSAKYYVLLEDNAGNLLYIPAMATNW